MRAPDSTLNILNHTLPNHRIGDFHEAGDIRAAHIVGLLIFTTILDAGVVNIQHDVMQACTVSYTHLTLPTTERV